MNLDYAKVEAWDTDGEATEEYWNLAQRELTKSLALVHIMIDKITGKISDN